MTLISNELESALEEARGFPIGTKRKRKDGWWIKTRQGWVRLSQASERRAKKDVDREKMAGTVQALQKAISTGKLKEGMALQQHVRRAKEMQRRHSEGFERLLSDLQDIAPGGKVKGRVKTLESILGKLVRKPKYGEPGNLQDTTGTRIIHESIDDVVRTVKEIKKKYKVIDEDDYISKPKEGSGYMSHHLIVEDKDGLQKEIQVRTRRQDALGDWAHYIYKPITKEQAEALKKAADEISQYAQKAWDYVARKDSGKDGTEPPPCPEIVKKVFDCAPVK